MQTQAGVAHGAGWHSAAISRAEAPAVNALYMKAMAAGQDAQHVILLIVLAANRASATVQTQCKSVSVDSAVRRALTQHEARMPCMYEYTAMSKICVPAGISQLQEAGNGVLAINDFSSL